MGRQILFEFHIFLYYKVLLSICDTMSNIIIALTYILSNIISSELLFIISVNRSVLSL